MSSITQQSCFYDVAFPCERRAMTFGQTNARARKLSVDILNAQCPEKQKSALFGEEMKMHHAGTLAAKKERDISRAIALLHFLRLLPHAHLLGRTIRPVILALNLLD